MTLNLEYPIQLKVRFTDGTLDVRLLRVSDSTVRIGVARGGGGVDWRAADALFLCVAELLVNFHLCDGQRQGSVENNGASVYGPRPSEIKRGLDKAIVIVISCV